MNPHSREPIAAFGAKEESARAAVILLHGRNQTPADVEREVVLRLGLADVAFVAPAAAGATWYPGGFMGPREENEPHLTYALERVRDLSSALARRGFPPEAQAVAGFSQGACLACDFVFREGRRFGALMAFTGGLVGPEGTRWGVEPGAWGGMPVLLGGSAEDPWVPASRMRETADVFRAGGARVFATFYEGKSHAVHDAQIALARLILEGVGPGRRARAAGGAP